jgi:broad specificity phosphatase PhoE
LKNVKTRAGETRWWWVRHAPVADNVRIYGQTDVVSDCSNAEVFASLARALPRDAVWLTSNLGRTHQTAEAIHAAMDEGARPKQRAIAVPAFAEQHLGDWQGEDRAEFYKTRRKYPFWFGPADERAPGGESFNDVIARVRQAVERLTRQFAGRDIVAVAHGGTIRAVLAISLQLPADHALAFTVDNCSITRADHLALESGEYWRIEAVNHRPWPHDAAAESPPRV